MARGGFNRGNGNSSNSTTVIRTSYSGGKRGLEKVISVTEHTTTTTGGKRALEINVIKEKPLS